jgi:hypothetical protein
MAPTSSLNSRSIAGANASSRATRRCAAAPALQTESELIQVESLAMPTDPATGRFSTELNTTPDFAGEVWAEVTYPDGTKKETQPIALTTKTAAGADALIPSNGGGSRRLGIRSAIQHETERVGINLSERKV